MQEAWAYPALYQEHGNRATDDLAIMILQGRNVGGGTTVNWTSSFRTPPATLRLWAERHGVGDLDAATLEPHFAAVEARLDVGAGNPDDVNANNRKLLDGAGKLGWHPELIRRSVKGCARLGYCGMGCPLDAKRTSRTTFLADAIAAGADVYSDCRVKLIETDRGRARAVVAEVLDRAADRPRGRLIVHARKGVVLAGGAINTPALLLRSHAGTDSGVVGKRTFLHPTVPMVAFYDQPIEGFYGAPQSVSVHHFADRGARVGYFLETAPVHPMLGAIALPGFGDAHRKLAERLPFVQATIALLIDGHHDDDGGRRRRQRERAHPPALPAARLAARGGDRRARQHGAPAARGRRPRGDDAARDPDRDPQRGRHRAHRRRAVRRQRPHPVLGPPDGRLRDGQRPAPLGGQLARPASPAREPLDRRRLGVPDLASAPTRSSRSTRTRACSRPRSRGPRRETTR